MDSQIQNLTFAITLLSIKETTVSVIKIQKWFR